MTDKITISAGIVDLSKLGKGNYLSYYIFVNIAYFYSMFKHFSS